MAALAEGHDFGQHANGMDAHMADAGGHGSEAIGSAVFISNLQWWTTDAEIEALAAPYGRILALRFIDDKSCGKSRGMAIVEYAEPGAADACIAALNGRDINGRPCRVAQQQSRSGRAGGGGGQFGGRGERRDARATDRGRSGRRDDMPPAGGDLMAQAGGMAGMQPGMVMLPGGMMAGGMLPGMVAGMGMPGMDMMQGMQGMMMMAPGGAPMMAPFGMPGMPGFKPPPPPGAPPPKKE